MRLRAVSWAKIVSFVVIQKRLSLSPTSLEREILQRSYHRSETLKQCSELCNGLFRRLAALIDKSVLSSSKHSDRTDISKLISEANTNYAITGPKQHNEGFRGFYCEWDDVNDSVIGRSVSKIELLTLYHSHSQHTIHRSFGTFLISFGPDIYRFTAWL